LKVSDPRKVLLAFVLWRRKNVEPAWIAKELAMRNAANVSLLLHRSDWKKLNQHVPENLRRFVMMQENAR